MATQFSFVAGHKGLAEFYVTNGSVAAAAFRINPTIALTSLPVVPANGAPVIGGTSSGSITPYVTFSASSLSFQPAGFPSGTVSLSLNLNASGGTYLTNVNGGFPTLTDGVFASSGRLVQRGRAASERHRAAVRSFCRSGRVAVPDADRIRSFHRDAELRIRWSAVWKPHRHADGDRHAISRRRSRSNRERPHRGKLYRRRSQRSEHLSEGRLKSRLGITMPNEIRRQTPDQN